MTSRRRGGAGFPESKQWKRYIGKKPYACTGCPISLRRGILNIEGGKYALTGAHKPEVP